MTTTAPAATPGIRAALRGQEPTPEQWAVITAPPGPVHLTAGAGSGKTAVMAARIVHLVEHHHVPPAGILGLTFTNKAATELAERVRAALHTPQPTPGQPTPGLPPLPLDLHGGGETATVSTYHAFAADLVATYGVRVGVEPGAALLTDAQQYQLLLQLLEQERFEHLKVRSPGPVVASALSLAAACADHLVAPAAVINHAQQLINQAEEDISIPRWMVDTARERIELGRLVTRYREVKLARGRIDFGDQVAKAVELVDRFEPIAAELRARYPHVLLDEYQDTNVAQRRLIQRLCPPGSSIMAVGDARQAIYAFRGATMYNLLEFPTHFPGDGGPPATRTLTRNFRSGRRILRLANAIVEPIPPERRGGNPLEPLDANGDGDVRAALLPDQVTEAAFVADQLQAAHDRGLPDGRHPAWRDMAVLVRSKRLLGPLREALEQRDIPVEVVGLSGLLETPEVVDLVSMLRVIDDPGANVALTRLLLGPRWRISHRHLARLTRWCALHNWTLREGLPGEDPDPGDVAFALAESLDHLDEVEGLDDDARTRLAAFRQQLRALRRHADGPLLDLAQAVLERTGVWAELDATPGRRAATARQNLAAFLDHVADFAPVDGDPSLRAFLTYLDAIDEAAEPVEPAQPAAGDSVKLMTVHQAKGLEFPVVAVAGLSAGTGKDGGVVHGIFPSIRVDNPLNARGFPYELREDAAHLPRWTGSYKTFRAALAERALEDERRLFYVAATRAKQLLILTAAWWYQGADKRPKGPSPFWREAAAHPAVTVLAEAQQPERSPLADRLAARRAWPPPARRPHEASDPLFPEGVAAAVILARRDRDALEGRLPEGDRPRYQEALAEQQELIRVAAAQPAPAIPPQAPTVLTVSDLVVYGHCPRAFYWSVVRPLPARPPGQAERDGQVFHRLLDRYRGQLPSWLGASPGGLLDQPLSPTVVRALHNYRGSRFATLPPPDTEVEVALRHDPWVIRGRIDAVYRTGDGVELVDWKTGGLPTDTTGDRLDQLGLYALALRRLGRLPADTCRVTYCHLGGDTLVERGRLLTPADLDHQESLLDATLARIAAGDWSPCGEPGCDACGRGHPR